MFVFRGTASELAADTMYTMGSIRARSNSYLMRHSYATAPFVPNDAARMRQRGDARGREWREEGSRQWVTNSSFAD